MIPAVEPYLSTRAVPGERDLVAITPGRSIHDDLRIVAVESADPSERISNNGAFCLHLGWHPKVLELATATGIRFIVHAPGGHATRAGVDDAPHPTDKVTPV
jgi:hypothetical protein